MFKKIMRPFLVVALCILLSLTTAYANTDGTELQVAQPSVLEIQLGTDWAGTQFRLRTDVGMYPGTITVEDDGVLRCEIGGSSKYIFSCTGEISDNHPEDKPSTSTEEIIPTSPVKNEQENMISLQSAIYLTIGSTLCAATLLILYYKKKTK